MSKRSYAALAPDYRAKWLTMRINPKRLAEVRSVATKIHEGIDRYKTVINLPPGVAERFKSVAALPPELIGVIHNMECSLRFDQHLHNGDPMWRMKGGTRIGLATVQVPAGRGPFATWEDSARDALAYDLDGMPASVIVGIGERRIEAVLYLLERYNGMGYRINGWPNPYLWSCSQHYTKGKYVADKKYDPEAVSKQCGVAPVLAELAALSGDTWRTLGDQIVV